MSNLHAGSGWSGLVQHSWHHKAHHGFFGLVLPFKISAGLPCGVHGVDLRSDLGQTVGVCGSAGSLVFVNGKRTDG